MNENKFTFHLITIMILGVSASFWAVLDNTFIISGVWLCALWLLVILFDSGEIRHLFKRLTRMGLLLLGASFLQLVFRRQGIIVLEIGGFPVIFSDGIHEAGLMWVRYMILIELAFLMARISLFDLLCLLDKIRVPLSFSLLLLTAFRLIPGVFAEAKRAFWFFQFRGIRFHSLSLVQKFKAVQQILNALLIRSISFQLHTALALELRGYGQKQVKRLPNAASLKWPDLFFIFVLLILNGWAFGVYFA